jgi:hypothetical protein
LTLALDLAIISVQGVPRNCTAKTTKVEPVPFRYQGQGYFSPKANAKGRKIIHQGKRSKGRKEYFENRSESNFSNEKINSKTNSKITPPKKKDLAHFSTSLKAKKLARSK